ncbi:hypothetical protein TrRE_jg6274, partial [Triparma retinervis]
SEGSTRGEANANNGTNNETNNGTNNGTNSGTNNGTNNASNGANNASNRTNNRNKTRIIPNESCIQEVENLVREKLQSPSTQSLQTVHSLIRSSFSTATTNLHAIHSHAINPDRSPRANSNNEFNIDNPASPGKQSSGKKERKGEEKEWNERGSTKIMKRSCLFLLYALAKVFHAVRDTTRRKSTGDAAGEAEIEPPLHPFSPPTKSNLPPRVDREGTTLDDITQKYEGTLVEIVPLVTHLAGRKGEGLLRLGDKHSRPVRRVLLSLQKSKCCRPELSQVWFRQLCMQEGWTYEDAISDWFEVGERPPPPKDTGEGKGEGGDKKDYTSPFPPPLPSEDLSTQTNQPTQGTNAATTNPGKNVPANSYIRHDVFNLPLKGGMERGAELWAFRFALCNLLRSFQGYKGISQNGVWLNSTYLAQDMAMHGRYRKEHLSLVVDKVMIEGVEKAKGIPGYGRKMVESAELETEFPELDAAEGKRQLEATHKGYDLVWDKERRKMYKQTNYDKEKQAFEVPKRSELRTPFVLPSLVSAYEFQLLNMRGYDLDLSCYFPGYYFKKVEERAKGLGLTSEILDRTKTNLKHISVAFSGLFITHQPSYILAAGIYLALKHQAGKQASGGAPNNSHVATMEAIARKLGLELSTIQVFSRHLQAVKDHMRVWYGSDEQQQHQQQQHNQQQHPQDQGMDENSKSLNLVCKTSKACEEALTALELTGITVKVASGEKRQRPSVQPAGPPTKDRPSNQEKRIDKQISKIPESTKKSVPKEVVEQLAEMR